MASPEVLIPTSPGEAAAAFGDGDGVTVVAGGTIVMPELTAGRVRPSRAILLHRAGLDTVSRDGGRVTIGAAAPLSALVGLPAPLGPCVANVADGEIRAQATLGGNVCAGRGHEAPRGDLQGPLLALGATARSTGADGEREEPLEAFLAGHAGRLLLSVSYDEAAAGAFRPLDRPHTHEYTTMAVSGVRAADGSVRLAVTGVAGPGCRLPSAEAAAGDASAAGEAALADVQLHDDALASAWYRAKVLPVLVRRVLDDLEAQA